MIVISSSVQRNAFGVIGGSDGWVYGLLFWTAIVYASVSMVESSVVWEEASTGGKGIGGGASDARSLSKQRGGWHLLKRLMQNMSHCSNN